MRVARAQWQARVHAPEGGGGRPLYPHVKTGLASAPGEPVWLDPREGEVHLGRMQQLSFGGENAEAYLSNDERTLVFRRVGAR